MFRLSLIVLLCLTLNGFASRKVAYQIQESSWFSITGTSNINSFECFCNEKLSNGIVLMEKRGDENIFKFSQAVINLNIKSLDCHNPFLNRDLYQTLNAEKNPEINIELQEANADKPQNFEFAKEYGIIKASVIITLNGLCKVISIDINWMKIADDTFQFSGQRELQMSDFDIVPPTSMLGLIKADNAINIKFNLIIRAISFQDYPANFSL